MIKKDSLKVLILNIRSLRANFNEFLLFLDSSRTKFDVIALTETWIRHDELCRYSVHGYTSYLQERNGNRSGGVMLYIKEGMTCEVEGVEASSFNALKLKICEQGSLKFTVLLIYRFCGGSKQTFVNELDSKLCGITGPAMLTGDINLDILQPHSCNEYLNLLASNGLRSLVNEPTRVGLTASSCLDHVFLRGDNSRISAVSAVCRVVPAPFSDHSAILADIRGVGGGGQQRAESQMKYEAVDFERLGKELFEVNWDFLRSSESVDSAFQSFTDKITTAIRSATTTKTLSSKTRKRAPWASSELVKLANEKANLYKLAKRYPQNEHIKMRLKDTSKKVTRQSRADKKAFYDKQLADCGTDVKNYWKVINSVVGKKKENIECLKVEDICHRVAGNENFLADKVNEYFCSIAKKLSDKVTPAGLSNHVGLGDRSLNSFGVFEFTEAAVYNAINGVANKDSAGEDNIRIKVVKECAGLLAPPLTYLFNRSLKEGIFPSSLKTAVVVPVYKGGDKAGMTNYRPIALLSVFSKVFEILMKERILSFLIKNKFFGEKQYGFLPKKCTDDALVSQVSEIARNLENGKKVAAVYLDITKAFDTVNHDILLNKLENCGFRGNILNWFTTYLKYRSQAVKLNNVFSDRIHIDSGVPQGSTLGPLLFLIYVNDLVKLNLRGSLYSFADDTAAVYVAENKIQLLAKINEDMKTLTSWFYNHRLFPNLSKTKIISFGYKNPPNLENCVILHAKPNCANGCDCKPISQVTEIKYLGVMLDSKMTWVSQTLYLQGKLRKLNYVLHYASQHFSEKHLIRIYTALYDSVLRYGIINWGGASAYLIKPLSVLQKRAIRSIAGIRVGDGTGTWFQRLKILNLEKLHKYCAACYVHKRKDMFNVQLRLRAGMRTGDVAAHVPHWIKVHSQQQGAYQAPRLYNGLPKLLRENVSMKCFSRDLKEYLLSLE